MSVDCVVEDISPFESEKCELYLKNFDLNVEELIPAETKVSERDNEIIIPKISPSPNKIKSRRPTFEVNGVQVKPKTLAEYREFNEEQKRKSIESDSSLSVDNNDNQIKNKSKRLSSRRNTSEIVAQNVKEENSTHKMKDLQGKKLKSETNYKLNKNKEELVIPCENTVTRSGRVSKKVLKPTEKVKDKTKKNESDDESSDDDDEDSEFAVKIKVPHKQKDSKPFINHCSSKFLLPDSAVDIPSSNINVIMYSGAGKHLHPYAIHNLNLLTQNNYDVSNWQRDFALTALTNNRTEKKNTKSINRSTVPLVSKKLINIKHNIKNTNGLVVSSEDRLQTKLRKKKNKKAVWTKAKSHSTLNTAQNCKKIKEGRKEISNEFEETNGSESNENIESNNTSLETNDDVNALKRKLNQNEEDDLYWEMYGTHKRVKLKLIQTQSDGNKKPQWTTSTNYVRGEKPEETEKEVDEAVHSVINNMVNHIELNIEYNEMDISFDPTHTESPKESNNKTEKTIKTLKRKRNKSCRVRYELKKLDAVLLEHDSETDENGNRNCNKDFCKLGCVCDSISVKPKNIAFNHCSEVECILNCICPLPKPDDDKKPCVRDESEMIRSVAEKRNGRNLAKKEKEWIQTLVKKKDEYIIMKNSNGSKNKREVKKPERYREEGLLWENKAQQKQLYEKVIKRSLREKAARKVTKTDSVDSGDSEEREKRRELKLLKKKKKKERLQESSKQTYENGTQEKKTSPFKFTFCFEHQVLDCKCKLKKEKEEDKTKSIEDKLKEINDKIDSYTNNLSKLTSDEKDQLLSLMREQQTLKDSIGTESKVNSDTKCDEATPVPSYDDEFMDLDKLSKFIPNPEVKIIKPESDLNQNTSEEATTKADITKVSEETADSGLSDDIEMVEEDEEAAPPPSEELKLVIQSVRSIRPDEFENQDGEGEIEIISAKLPPKQHSVSSVSNTLTALTNECKLFDQLVSGARNIDYYGFMLNKGFGYLPIAQYSPKTQRMVLKDPTKTDPVPMLFTGANYQEAASEWANTLIRPYVNFMPYDLKPQWKLVKFSTTEELGKLKLLDFKFLREYYPMIYTRENIIYRSKNNTLYKLMYVESERCHKFKAVMSCKHEMSNPDFISKYEYIFKKKNIIDTKLPIQFIQNVEIINGDKSTKIPIESHMSNTKISFVPNKQNEKNVQMSKISPGTNQNQISRNNPTNALTNQNQMSRAIPTTSTSTNQNQISRNISTKSIPTSTSINSNVNQRSSPTPSSSTNRISVKPPEILLNRVPSPVFLQYPNTNGFINNIQQINQSYPNNSNNILSQQQHRNNLHQIVRQNLKNNINKTAISKLNNMNTGQPLNIFLQPNNLNSQNPPVVLNKGTSDTNIAANSNNNNSFGRTQNIPNQIPLINTKKNQNTHRHNLPNINSLLNKKPSNIVNNIVTNNVNNSRNNANTNFNNLNVNLNKMSSMEDRNNFLQLSDLIVPNNQTVVNTNNNVNNSRNNVNTNFNNLNANLNKMNSMEDRNKFIQLSDLIVPTNQTNKTNEISNINKSHPILTKSLETPSPSTSSSRLIRSIDDTLEEDVEEKLNVFAIWKPGARVDLTKSGTSVHTIKPPPPPPPPLMKRPFKKPIPGLKAIQKMPLNDPRSPVTLQMMTPSPRQKLTDEVEIVATVSPVHHNQEMEIEITKINTTEPECIVEEINAEPDISIMNCFNKLEASNCNLFKPITFTPNGEDTVTISPIINNNNGRAPPLRTDFSVFEKIAAIKRINDGEPLDVVARYLNVSIETLKFWHNNFQNLHQEKQRRIMNRKQMFSNGR